MCGKLEEYNDEYDRVRARGAKKLQPSRDVLYFSHVPTRDDPVLERAAREGQASVFATDVVLAQLMAAPRSVLPWDLLVTYENGQIFLDKRPGNNGADTLTVHENAALPNTNEDEKDINSISNLRCARRGPLLLHFVFAPLTPPFSLSLPALPCAARRRTASTATSATR